MRLNNIQQNNKPMKTTVQTFISAMMMIGFMLASLQAKSQVIDTIAPVIHINQDTCIQVGTIWSLRDSVSDNLSSVNYNFKTTVTWPNGLPNSTKFGVHPAYFEATDSSGNIGYLTVNFRVDDCIAPTIDLNTADTICHQINTTYIAVTPTAADNYYPNNQVAVVKVGSVDAYTEGMYAETYTATDASGNKSSKTRYVIVGACNLLNVKNLDDLTINLFPNPANEKVHIANINEGIAKLYDLNGKLVFEQIYQNQLIEIDIATFANGIYNLILTTKKGIGTAQFVVQH